MYMTGNYTFLKDKLESVTKINVSPRVPVNLRPPYPIPAHRPHATSREQLSRFSLNLVLISNTSVGDIRLVGW